MFARGASPSARTDRACSPADVPTPARLAAGLPARAAARRAGRWRRWRAAQAYPLAHASRAFLRSHGMPPQLLRRELRCRRALALLAGDAPMAEVAAPAGFSDQSHLNRTLRAGHRHHAVATAATDQIRSRPVGGASAAIGAKAALRPPPRMEAPMKSKATAPSCSLAASLAALLHRRRTAPPPKSTGQQQDRHRRDRRIHQRHPAGRQRARAGGAGGDAGGRVPGQGRGLPRLHARALPRQAARC